MSTTKPIGGYGDVSYNGNVLPFRGELVWSFQLFTSKAVAGRDARVHGSLLEPKVPYIEGTFTFDGTYSTAQLEAIADATVSANLASGMQLVLRGARIAGDIDPEADEAKVKLRWEGTQGEELLAAG
jgi:hypothetical protein